MPLVATRNTGLTEDQVKNIVKQTVKEISNGQIDHERKITVFVSHKFKERDMGFAKKLQDKLKEYGIAGYLAEHKKEYGYIISNKIKDAIRDSICVVVILTKDSMLNHISEQIIPSHLQMWPITTRGTQTIHH